MVLSALLCQGLAHAVELRGEAVQGGLIFGKTTPGARVQLDDTEVMVSAQGDFVIGFGRDESGERTLLIQEPSGANESLPLAVAPRDYAIERVDGLPPRTVTPDPDALERIREEGAMVASARARRDARAFRAGHRRTHRQPRSCAGRWHHHHDPPGHVLLRRHRRAGSRAGPFLQLPAPEQNPGRGGNNGKKR